MLVTTKTLTRSLIKEAIFVDGGTGKKYKAVQLVSAHTHVYTRLQPSCPSWTLTKLPLRFNSRIVVGSNTATEISCGVLIQV